jgi:arylformamidase
MTLYQGYDLQALEEQYDIEATVPAIEVYRVEYGGLSEAAIKNCNPSLGVSYGSEPLQNLDIFPSDNTPSPIVVYIHGGYWKAGDKAGYGFPCAVFNQAGITWIPINYRLAPNVSLDEIIDDVRCALAWVHSNATDFGGDPDRIIVSGSSAGGHLTGMIAAKGWHSKYGLPENVVKGVAAMSGLYDLEPFLHTSQKNYLNLDVSAVERNSPVQNLPRADLPMLIAWAGKETDEFMRQSQDYANLCQAAGNSVETLFYKEHNHFSLGKEFSMSQSDLVKGILELIN